MGLQVPPYAGHSMDPPLRSRFQSKHIDNLGANSVIDILQNRLATISTDKTDKSGVKTGVVDDTSSTNTLAPPPVDRKQLSKVVGLYETLREQKAIALKEGVTLGGLPSLNVRQMEYCLGIGDYSKGTDTSTHTSNTSTSTGTTDTSTHQQLKPEQVVARVERCMPALTWMQSSVHQRLRPLLAR